MTGQAPVEPATLRRIRATNLLSFGPEGIDLELAALNVLIGPNGSGKSNLLEATGCCKQLPTIWPLPSVPAAASVIGYGEASRSPRRRSRSSSTTRMENSRYGT